MLPLINYRTFNHAVQDDPTVLGKVVTCYQAVFAAQPWSEWRRCANPKCEAHWGIEQAAELAELGFSHHGQPVEEFWSTNTVRADLAAEFAMAGASSWLALSEGDVVGFCYGYPLTPAALEAKLELTNVEAGLAHRFGEQTLVAYQDDLGVRNSHRRRGIARAMFGYRQADFVASGLMVCVVRTMPGSVTYIWYMKLGYKLVAEYPDGRVVLASTLT